MLGSYAPVAAAALLVGAVLAILPGASQAAPTDPRASVPQNITAKGVGASVVVTWSPPAWDGGRQITGYYILKSDRPYCFTLVANLGPVLKYTDSNVSRGSTYWYIVIAVTSYGQGQAPFYVNATVPLAKPRHAPGPPAAALALTLAVAALAREGLRRKRSGPEARPPR